MALTGVIVIVVVTEVTSVKFEKLSTSAGESKAKALPMYRGEGGRICFIHLGELGSIN